MTRLPRMLFTAALLAAAFAGCGSAGPADPGSPQVVGPGGADAFQVTSDRMSGEGWKALDAYRKIIHRIGGRSRTIEQGAKQYNNQGRCLKLPGTGVQADRVRNACVNDFSFGARVLDVNHCLTAGGGMSVRDCITPVLAGAAKAAQDAAQDSRDLADTVKPGECRATINAWAQTNERMSVALGELYTKVRHAGRRDGENVARDAAKQFSEVAHRETGHARWQELCQPLDAR